MAKDFNNMSVSDFFDTEDDKDAAPDKVAALEKQVAELTGRIAALTTQTPREVAPLDMPEPPALVELSFDDLPDMYAEPQNYQKALAKRIQENNLVNQRIQSQYEAEVALVRSQQEGRVDALWNDFTAAYPDLKQYEDQVRFVAERLAFEKQRAGVDVPGYIFGAKDQFFKDVADGVKKFIPQAPTAGADTTTLETPQGDDMSRTLSVFGGTMNAFGPGAKPDEGKQGADMIKDLHKMQRAGGFF